jgi:hypothetical protein
VATAEVDRYPTALGAELNREVALKQILEQHADNPVSRQRFLLDAIDGSPSRSDEIKKDPHIKALESRPEFRTLMDALQSAQR